MKTNYNKLAKELDHKVKTGNVTKEDAETAAKVARATGRIQDRVLYVKIKQEVQRKA